MGFEVVTHSTENEAICHLTKSNKQEDKTYIKTI